MTKRSKVRVGFVVPHVFIHRDILPQVIFSPGTLALALISELETQDVEVTLFTPGPADTKIRNITANLSYFEEELAVRGDTYMDLLRKHPFTFISLARQIQSEVVAKAYDMANRDELDVIHIYTNEEDIALPFAKLCKKPVVFTHHDPFNFLVKYKNVFPKYKDLNWISMSYAQRAGMPSDTNWVANIYHGLDENTFTPIDHPSGDYVAYLGRIIEPKGVHFAIEAVRRYNETAAKPLTLKIAGKHYAEHTKDTYWQTKIEPDLGESIEYVGHIKTDMDKREFLGNAKALLVPSTFNEPFGMVTIEALACGTPVIGLDRGATAEIIEDGVTGHVLSGTNDIPTQIVMTLSNLDSLNRQACRTAFEKRFTLERMAKEHAEVYQRLATKSPDQL